MKNWSENWIDNDFNIRRVDINVCLIQPHINKYNNNGAVTRVTLTSEFPDSGVTDRHTEPRIHRTLARFNSRQKAKSLPAVT